MVMGSKEWLIIQMQISNVPFWPIVAPVLFDIFIGDVDNGTECNPIKFAEDTNLNGMIDTDEGWVIIQRDQSKLEKWACVNIMRFSKVKCKVLPLVQGSPQYQWKLKEDVIENSPVETYIRTVVG